MNLENIPWGRIHHFYGRATRFPEQLKSLSSGSHENQNHIYDEMERNIEVWFTNLYHNFLWHDNLIIRMVPIQWKTLQRKFEILSSDYG